MLMKINEITNIFKLKSEIKAMKFTRSIEDAQARRKEES